MTERDINDLDRFWNALAAGSPDDGTGIDPTKAETLRQFHAAEDVPGADPVFLERLLKNLIGDQQAASPMPGNSVRATNPNGHAGIFPWRSIVPTMPDVAGRRRWGFGQFATAVLVLLVLGLVYYTLGPGRSGNDGPAVIPPVVIPTETPVPTATPETTEETLLEVTLPAEALPRSESVGSGIADAYLAPGTRSRWEPREPYCCPGPMIEYVVEGTYTVRAEAATQVVRAGGTVEEVPAGTEITLGPGDTLISRNETVVESANTGTTPVILLNWTLVDDVPPGTFAGHRLQGWTQRSADVQGPVTLPEAPITLRLRRVNLAADAVIPEPPRGDFQFRVALPQKNAAGKPVPYYVERADDGSIHNGTRQAVTVYVLTMDLPAPSANSPVPGSPMPERLLLDEE